MNPHVLMTTLKTTQTTQIDRIIENKGNIGATVAAAAAGAGWSDLLHSGLEWAALILAVLSGSFALYWNICKCIDRKRGRK